MSYEISPAFRRAIRLVTILAASATIAGCQVKPLYSTSTGVAPKLASVEFSQASDRVTQLVRNHLIFLASGGAGEPVKSDYFVQLSVASARADVLDEETSANFIPGRVTLTGSYTLTHKIDGKVIRSATRKVTSLVDVGPQQFAKLRAYRDAEDRAGRELAEFIRADIAAALSR
ncbi:LPS assembly lipoprotein LptE [Rhizobium oryzicola]|uniref:LPS assembly lipoprotein LptE n=1 Tax=Rhizobium oryzicola TaxID=1232668 RepID=A0ABT8T2E9_9HYPH|nr:LPS assembly lipoprotein LptE [Rhizobium oryzicola]MDO1584740.1 LPS assembly lipoprotein LptE [Rhizobium oryzicola]